MRPAIEHPDTSVKNNPLDIVKQKLFAVLAARKEKRHD
jgi:hypothetical protein